MLNGKVHKSLPMLPDDVSNAIGSKLLLSIALPSMSMKLEDTCPPLCFNCALLRSRPSRVARLPICVCGSVHVARSMTIPSRVIW
jgi:hypothetical protein